MNTYDEKEILKNSYIDVINYAGKEGINAKLKVEDVLPIIAAPYTVILSIHTDTDGMRKIAEELVSFLRISHTSFDRLEYDEIVAKLKEEWISTIAPDRAEEIACNLSLIDSFDENGYAIFKEGIWNFYAKQKNTDYRKVEYYTKNSLSRNDSYDFSSEKNVFTIKGKRVRVWTLNTEYRDYRKMMSQDAVIIYNEYNASRDIFDFSSFEGYRNAYFAEKNADKKFKNWDHEIKNDQRCFAYWRFCKIVKEGDIIYLVQGSQIYGYCTITGEHVETSKEYNAHGWECKWTKFEYPEYVVSLRATPFFMYVDNAKMNRIIKAGAGIE